MKNLIFLIIVSLLINFGLLSADVPYLIDFQGRLADDNGDPIMEDVNIVFAIYEDSTGGVATWNETHTVDVLDGLFHVTLGKITPFDEDIFDSSETWLGITVETDSELSPRTRLTSVPYAIKSDYVEHDLRNTLDEAYDEGGAGSGRSITVDAGSVELEVPASETHSGLLVETYGDSNAIKAQVKNTTSNSSPAISGIHYGNNEGVYGRSGTSIPAGMGSAKISGVAGESVSCHGVSGYSKDKDGIHGGTYRTGTFSDGPYSIVGGVHGEPSQKFVTNGDNFAVVGTPSDNNNSTGVLGIGAQVGHGVIGIPGGDGASTTAGIRGITREPTTAWPPTNFPLEPNEYKGQIGVLGQAKDYVAIWGESISRIGVVGTSGDLLTLDELPFLDPIGVYGSASQEDGIGVLGAGWEEGIGVLGQSHNDVAVWGESISRIGVVGSSGDLLTLDELPPYPVGVYGTTSDSWGTGVYGDSDDGVGVYGDSENNCGIFGASTNNTGIVGSTLSDSSTHAGIRAEGHGVSANGPNAAALEINNGAIRVSGPVRPSGTFTVTGNWNPLNSCGNGDPYHTHEIGQFTMYNLQDNLIVGDPDGSIILLTVENQSYYSLYAHVVSKTNGSAQIRITAMGCSMTVGDVKVHYLIINPASQTKF